MCLVVFFTILTIYFVTYELLATYGARVAVLYAVCAACRIYLL